MSDTNPPLPVLVIGVGALERGDDAVGRLVARQVRDLCPDSPFRVIELRGDATELMEAWAQAKSVLLIDAACTGAPPGTLHRFDASCNPLPAEMAHTSTHDMGVSDALELARAMAMLPDRVIVYAIEIGQVDHGNEPSAAVLASISEAATAVTHEAEELTQGRTPYA
jgi:hydrogenase maturation protease